MLDEGLTKAALKWHAASGCLPGRAISVADALPMVDPDVSRAAGGDLNITCYRHWAIAEDEALLIGMHAVCEYTSTLQLLDGMLWTDAGFSQAPMRRQFHS